MAPLKCIIVVFFFNLTAIIFIPTRSIGEFSWSGILKDCDQVQRDRERKIRRRVSTSFIKRRPGNMCSDGKEIYSEKYIARAELFFFS